MKTSMITKLAGVALSSAMIIGAVPTVSLANDVKMEGNCLPMCVYNDFETDAKVTSSWDKHSIVEFTIKNDGTKPIKNWHLTFVSPYKIESIWCASVSESNGEAYTISNLDWNKDIPVGGSVTFGIIFASDNESKLNAIPDWYIMNTREDGSLGFNLDSDINYNGRGDYYDMLEYYGWEGELPEVNSYVVENAMTLKYDTVFDILEYVRIDTFTVDINGTDLNPDFVFDINILDSEGDVVATLNDRGEDGDQVANDGIFTMVTDNWRYSANPVYHAEVVINKFTFKSNEVDIDKENPLVEYSEEDREGFHLAVWELMQLDSNLKTADMSKDEKAELYIELLDNLSKGTAIADYTKPTIDMDYTYYDGNGNLYFMFSIGLYTIIRL